MNYSNLRMLRTLAMSFALISVVGLAETEDEPGHVSTPTRIRMSGLQARGSSPEQGLPVRPRAIKKEEVKLTKSGKWFVRDGSNPNLGEAWRDPRGTIWGDIVRDDKGKVREMSIVDAIDYCKSIGATLPSYEDFSRLLQYMGAPTGNAGYRPEVLPNLIQSTNKDESFGYLLWSSSVHPKNTGANWSFDSYSGWLTTAVHTQGNSVRCVKLASKESQKSDGSRIQWIRDATNPKLGEAWRDPEEMVWGDIAKKVDGTVILASHEDAIQYCKSIGAILPSSRDYERLREYMGARPGVASGYRPQVLPNLKYVEDGQPHTHFFWSSSSHPTYARLGEAFQVDGNWASPTKITEAPFRCVVPKAPR